MNKQAKHVLLGIFLLLTSLLIMGCKSTESIQLEAPTNVSINGNVVSWDAVELASGYTVSVNNTEHKVQTTSYTILINQPGTYQVKVRADGEGEVLTSPWSSTVQYVIQEQDPDPIIYMISETFDDASAKDEWSLGGTENMHDVQNGQLILTNTGLVPYPSRGKHLRVTLSEYPYLAVKVDDLGGNNARWAIKIMMAGDQTSSRDVTPSDMTTAGLFFFDLTKVEGLENLDYAAFDLYIYIIESEGNYVKIDYLQSVANIPEINNFDDSEGLSVTGGTMVAEHGVLRISSEGSSTASVTTQMYIDSSIANMVDLFISQVSDSSSFSLKIDGVTVIDNATRYGHFGLDLVDLGIEQTGLVDVEFIVNGEISVDRIANVAYNPYVQTFEDYDDISIYDLVNLSGSADVSVNDDNELVIHKIAALTGEARATLSGTSNFSTYPKFTFEVTAIDENATLRVIINGRTVRNVTAAGTFNVDMTNIYQTGYRKVTVEFMLISEGDATATVSEFSFVRDEELSKNALPEKGDRVELEGMIDEGGHNSDNWVGNATVFSRNGQIWIVNSDFFSKGEVFGRNIDLQDYRYLNLKLDELTPGATWKMDVMYDVGLATQHNYTIQNEVNTTGLFTYDLYHLMNLNEDTKTSQRLSISFFIIGGNDKIAKIDYINLKQTPDAENEIILVKPVDNMQVTVGAEVLVSASLKYPLGHVSIKVENDDVDVTSTVLVDGVFSTTDEGVYTITYSFEGVQSKTRTITVTSEPVITTDNTSTTINYDQPLDILATVQPNDDSTVTYQAFLGEDDVSDVVFTVQDQGVRFNATETGNYRIVMQSETTDAVEITITVQTGWISEVSGNNQNNVVDGNLVLSYSGGYYWPKHEKIVTVTEEQLYLVVDAKSITGGTWKLDIDGLMNNAIPESSQTGLHVIDLSALIGESSQKEMKFVVLIVGSDIRLELNAFTFMSLEEVAENYNSIINVVPATNQTVSAHAPISVSAALKYAVDGHEVSVKVVDSNELDITDTVLQDGVVTLTQPGVYQIIYESSYADSVTRTVTVLNESEPILSTTNDSETSIEYNQAYPLNVEVENPVDGEVVTYVVTKDGELDDLSNLLIQDGVFTATETGVYTVTASYEDALDLVQTITVVTGWIHENITNGGAIESSFINDEFTIHYAGPFHWPTSKYLINITTDLTPFVSFNVNSITGGTWKLQLGDPYHVDIIAEGTTTGHILIDLRTVVASAGYGETHNELTMTFTVYIVGGDVNLKLTPFEVLTEEQVAQNYNEIVHVTPQNNVSVLPDVEVNVGASLKYPVVGEEIIMTVNNDEDTDVTSEVLIDGKFKTSTPGLYTVYYENALADLVTRTIEVVAPETPVITSTNEASETILIDQPYVLDINVDNPVDGQSLSYAVYKDGGEVDIVLAVFNESTMTFETDTTGSYEIVVSYQGANDLILTVIVKTAWVPAEENTVSITAVEGVTTFHYNGGFYWPKATTITPVTTDETPYLVLQVDEITGGTWKMELGDPYAQEIVSSGTTTGQIIIDLRDYVAGSGYGQTDIELNMTLAIFVIGENVTLKVSSIQFLTQAQRDLLL